MLNIFSYPYLPSIHIIQFEVFLHLLQIIYLDLFGFIAELKKKNFLFYIRSAANYSVVIVSDSQQSDPENR